MADTGQAQAVFEQWRKQMEEGAQFWAQIAGRTGQAGPDAADPLKLWRPFMEQVNKTWAGAMPQGAGSLDMTAQAKALLDQWVGAWDKLLAETMQTEAFAQAMGKHLDQWLNAQGPSRKASAEATEATLQALGVPSRTQVVGIARQLMDLDDRMEAIEEHLAALRATLDGAPKRPAAPSGRTRGKRKPKAGE